MKLALLAALAAAGLVQPQQKPLKDFASTAALCVGWSNVQRYIQEKDGLTTGDIGAELGEKIAPKELRTLLVGDITISPSGRCGRPLPTAKRVRYPGDFQRPHAPARWTSGTATHTQILIFRGRDESGGYYFLLLTGDSEV